MKREKKKWVAHVFNRLTLNQNAYLGGDPAAGSPTATLLRLLPSYVREDRT